jgi:hypothetical protein
LNVPIGVIMLLSDISLNGTGRLIKLLAETTGQSAVTMFGSTPEFDACVFRDLGAFFPCLRRCEA